MRISIVGMGMGNLGTLTADTLEAIYKADILIGAERLLSAVPEDCRAERHSAIRPEDIMRFIDDDKQAKRVCVLMSGDVSFYSGAKKLLTLLDGYEVEVLPGISSMQYFAARLKRPWQDWKLISAHGINCCAAVYARDSAETFFLTGGELSVQALCAQLNEAGFGDLLVTVGESLGSADEAIYQDTASNLAQSVHGDLAVMLVDNPSPRTLASCGLPDDAFIRGDIPMTKSEVRSVILSKLRLHENDIVYDVGAGTGSVSIEAALLVKSGHVYAIEREEEGCNLIRENAKKLGGANLTCINGEAPDSLAELPAPDAVFIGGSGGFLDRILDDLLRLNPAVRLVVSTVTLETLAEATAAFSRLSITDVEIVQLAVSKAKLLGAHHLMMAQNPIFIISGVGCNG
jgi:precorrin-6B C5,15-methyltransferase / cobalt-precorrin-6B C5,C15-methyltransferase